MAATATKQWAATERDGAASERSSQRSKARDIEIPPVANLARRLDCLADPFLFLPTYMPRKFSRAMTADRRRMVEEIIYRIKYGGDKALAAPRSRGKTTIGEGVVGVYAILAGMLRFPLIVGATGEAADGILRNIKYEYETNDLLLADFPEVCVPIRALEGWASRANMQTVNGERTRLKWGSDMVVFPTIAGSDCSGAILATRSIDGQVRGLRVNSQRPDFALIDDPETRSSAKSETEREKRSLMIDDDIGGLGGPDETIPKLILTTTMSCASLSFQYTDPKQKPAYAGERMRAVDVWPNASELWEKYVETRKDNKENGDVEAREANQFYLDNREVMDAGASVSDEDAYDHRLLEDGTPKEVSAIQHIYNLICDKGRNYVDCELQNDPPTDEEDEKSKLTESIVRGSNNDYRGRMSGFPQSEIPPGVTTLTAFVDMGQKMLTWEVCGWTDDARCFVVDYGKQNTDSVDVVGIPEALRRGLNDVADYFREKNYKIDVGLIDSGSGVHTKAVYQWINQNSGPWYPSKGDGRYSPPALQADKSRKTSAHWNKSPQDGCHKPLIVMDADFWKREVGDSFLTVPLNERGEQVPRSVRLFGVDPHQHGIFASEIIAEEWQRKFVEGKGYVEGWKQVKKANHYLDTHYGNMAARAVAVHQKRPSPVISGINSPKSFIRTPSKGWFGRDR
jgi:hypothetical protein